MVNWEEGEKAFMGAEGRIYAQFAFDESLSGPPSLHLWVQHVSLFLLNKDPFMLCWVGCAGES